MAVDMFLEIQEIPGKSQKKGHEGQWDLLSFSYGVVQQGSFQVGGRGGGSGKAEFQDISIVKYVDKASPKLFEACAKRHPLRQGYDLCAQGRRNPLEYLKIELEDLIVSSVQNSGSASGDAPMRIGDPQLREITEKYVEQTAEGGEGRP